MLKAQMQSLAEIMARLSAEARAAALEATVTLATTVLRAELGSRLEDEENRPSLFAAARVFIDQHLCSHHMNADLIAKNVGCSRAHLYRVFAAHGITVADYVREVRLQRARALLAAGHDKSERIGDIAFRCGFDDPLHFARLFRCRFGVTPREVRASKGLAQAAAPSRLTASRAEPGR